MSSQEASPSKSKSKSKRKPLKPLVFKGEEVKPGYLVRFNEKLYKYRGKTHDGYLELISVNLSRNSRSDESDPFVHYKDLNPNNFKIVRKDSPRLGKKSKRKGSIKKFNKTKKGKIINKNFDKYIGKVIQLKLPKSKNRQWYWLVRKNENDKYIIRSPKIGVLINDLDKKRNKDYGPEKLMPIGTKIF